MRAFVQSVQGAPNEINASVAKRGLWELGVECIPFTGIDDLPDGEPEDLVVAGIGTVRSALARFGVEAPEICYPEELHPFLGRRVWKSTVGDVFASLMTGGAPVFVKSTEAKELTGLVARNVAGLAGLGGDEGMPVWVSEPVRFLTEWRCFVRHGQILDVRPYRGSWKEHFDPSVVEETVATYSSAPAGYAADFGVTEDGRTLLVEVNDGYSLGAYGLSPIPYARLLSARWAELAGAEDMLDF